MAKITELIDEGKTFSFELFPPRNEKGTAQLEQTLHELAHLDPSFVSITYGAGGSTRDLTNQLVRRILQQGETTPMAHLVCAAHSRQELTEILANYAEAGLQNVLALRGDPPLNAAQDLRPGELTRASELVELARSVGDFCVAVAMHPEGHPGETARTVDRSHQAYKLEQADFGITQFFFEAEDFLRLVEDVKWYGVDKPIIPGIMPPTHISQLEKMAKMSGATVPAPIKEALTRAGDDMAEAHKVGVDIATGLCQRLLAAGAPGLHFYTMNRSSATREIFENLNLNSEVR